MSSPQISAAQFTSTSVILFQSSTSYCGVLQRCTKTISLLFCKSNERARDMAATTHPVNGKYIHFAGSASKLRDTSLIRYAHDLVRRIATEILRSGGGIGRASCRERV